jgi:hypothetical protein
MQRYYRAVAAVITVLPIAAVVVVLIAATLVVAYLMIEM